MKFEFRKKYSAWLNTKSDKRRTCLFFLLYPFSFIYLVIVSIKNVAYKFGFIQPKFLKGFVISVGNISVGGAGKTPFTLFLLKELLQYGAKPVVLTRGYGAGLKSRDYMFLMNGAVVHTNTSENIYGLDEPHLISHNFPTVPVLVAAKRSVAANFFLKIKEDYNPTHWILDDGFQHRKVKRNLDIVLIDGLRDLENEACIPAGLLREPLKHLSRADLLVFIKTRSEAQKIEMQKKYSRYSQNILFANFKFNSLLEVVDGKLIPTSVVPKKIYLLAAIAQPQHFNAMVRATFTDVEVIKEVYEPDHSLFNYDAHGASFSKGISILTTEKDYWRQPGFFRELIEKLELQVFIFKVHVELDGLNREKIGC